MSDNRTTELMDGLRNVGNLHEFAELFGFDWHDDSDWTWHDVAVKMADELEQAIAATLGSEREKALEELVQDVWAAYSAKAESSFHPAWEVDSELARRMDALGFEVVSE